MPGLTETGLEIPTLADVREGLNSRWREEFGQSMDTSDRSPDGQLIGIVAEQGALDWELLEAIVAQGDVDKATGIFQDALCALTGTERRPATFSTVTLTLTGVPTSFVAKDSLASTESTGQQFTTTEDATIAAATAWSGTTTYTVGDRRTNAGNMYLCTIGGTSAASGGPSGTDAAIIDGTVTWRFLGEGTGFVDVVARAKVTGPIVAVAGDITGRDTPVGGWQGVTNILDATLGRLKEPDPQLRVRRELEIARPGTGTPDAIQAALLDVGKDTNNPVTTASVFVNNTDLTDSDGIPPHSVESLVIGGEDQDIRNALLANVSAGIRTHGTVTGTAVDSSGKVHTIKFTRTQEIEIYVSVTLVKDPATYPADGDDQVKLAIATAGNEKPDGTDVVSSAVLARVFSVPGVIQVDLPLISAAPVTVPVSTATIVVSLRQRAVYDTGRITVTSSNGVP